MKRCLAILVLALTQVGCLHPLTSRLDRTNQQLELAREQLERANVTLVEANARLHKIEVEIEKANHRLDRFLKRLGGLAALEEEVGRQGDAHGTDRTTPIAGATASEPGQR